ncbi:transcriptional repressor [Spirosoma gilvum]
MNWNRKNKTRLASRRDLIRQLIMKYPASIHPESVYLQLRNQQIRIGLGTIYAALNQLAEEGIVLKSKGAGRSIQYRIHAKIDNLSQ